jgi:hypothetical protein
MLKLTRGERNFNPGNIERSETFAWKGQAADQSADERFVVFRGPTQLWGIRAIAKILLTYSRKYPQDTPQDIDTVREVITRWAPPKNKGVVENDTETYIHEVAKEMGVSAHQQIDITDEATMKKLVVAIIRHENGRVIERDEVIDDAIRRALA